MYKQMGEGMEGRVRYGLLSSCMIFSRWSTLARNSDVGVSCKKNLMRAHSAFGLAGAT